jgi:carbon-monoxide dehydrogenase iron sulfur subunit
MKEVVVHPERCVGCMQCMAACAVAHSQTQSLHTALGETPLPRARIHVGVGSANEGFPNRCRHCDPAPCLSACLAGAIFQDSKRHTVFINADRCINCASCAMACPYGVIRFDQDGLGPPGRTVALKCDNCIPRVEQDLLPACVEVCKTQALTYEEIATAMKRKTDRVARGMTPGEAQASGAPGWDLLNALKRRQISIGQ